MSVWAVATRKDLAQRLRRLLESIEPGCVLLDGLTALEKAASRAPSGTAVLDWELLSPDPGVRMRDLRGRMPSVDFIVVGDEDAIGSPGVSGLLSAGALDILSAAAADEALSARLRAHLETRPSPVASGMLESGGLRMDLRRREVLTRGGTGKWRACGNLTPKEFDILRILMERPGVELMRRSIMEKVWGERSDTVNVEAVDKHVASLRRKLGLQGKRIWTLRGVGFILKES